MLVDVLLRGGVEALLGAAQVVLADLAVLLQLLQVRPWRGGGRCGRRCGRPRPCALASLMYSLRRSSVSCGTTIRHRVAVVAGVDAEVGVADGLLDGADGAAVEGGDQQRARVGRRERGELLQRRRRAVVVGVDLVEHRRVGAAGADGRHVLAGEVDGVLHLVAASFWMFGDHG